jgi:hypothetical protein
MFENLPDWSWLLLAYVSGSVVAYALNYKSITMNAVEKTIDSLIESGYLKATKNDNGEVILHKYDE